jgi:8-oxo-dGTP pyrophosphatase MutT (NUDIX family)
MLFHELINLIPKIQEIKLPGLEAQLKMAPPGRDQLLRQSSQSPRKAAVICLLYPDKAQRVHFCLIKRAPYPGVHSNQVGFPGGQLDDSDKSLWEAALRELQEELGLIPIDVFQIKKLSPLYIPPSNFWVQPFLGLLKKKPVWMPDPDEVSQVIEVSLHSFLYGVDPVTTQIESSDGNVDDVPIYLLEGFKVWGATAMMLAEVKALFMGA